MEAMEDSLQLEWSTKTFETLSQLLGAISRPRASTNPLSLNPPLSPPTSLPSLVSESVQLCAPNLLVDRDVRDLNVCPMGAGQGHVPLNRSMEGDESSSVSNPLLHMSMKLDVSNISVFICDSAGGVCLCCVLLPGACAVCYCRVFVLCDSAGCCVKVLGACAVCYCRVFVLCDSAGCLCCVLLPGACAV